MKRLTPAAVTLMMVVVVGLLVTAYVAKRLVAGEAKTPPVAARSYPAATETLEPGDLVTALQLGTFRARPEALGSETLLSERQMIGRVVKERILAGEPIRSSQLYPRGEHPPLDVAAGMRAVSTTLGPEASIVNGLLRAGQFVDVHLTPRLDASGDPRRRCGTTRTLFEGVRLLAITRNDANPDAGASVTLELTPRQANLLILARENGQIALSYNPEGKGTFDAAGNGSRATLAQLLPEEGESLVRRPFVSEIYKGSARSTLEFPHPIPQN